MKAKSIAAVLPLALFVSLFLLAAASQAQVRVYKVTYLAKASVHPKLRPPEYSQAYDRNTFKGTGYFIVNTANPNESRSITLLSGKRYAHGYFNVIDIYSPPYVNSLHLLNYDQFRFEPLKVINLKGGTHNDTVSALAVGFYESPSHYKLSRSASLKGAIPKSGSFRMGGMDFPNEAKLLRLEGGIAYRWFDASFLVRYRDFWKEKGLLRFDRQNAVFPALNVTQHFDEIIARLTAKGYTRHPYDR